MDLLQENPIKDNKEKKLKISLIVVGVLVFVLIIIAIVIYFFAQKAQMSQFKVVIDGSYNTNLANNKDNVFIIENQDKIYISIRDIAKAIGYEVYNGEYKQYTEDKTSCYATNSKELVTFTDSSKEIRKYPKLSDSESQTFELDEAISSRGNNIYISKSGLEKAFNLKLTYIASNNTININTLSYITALTAKKYPKASLSDNGLSNSIIFNNQKALLNNLIVIEDTENKLFGVATPSSDSENGELNEIITARYKSIEFIEGIEDFIVRTEDSKYGIIGKDGITKVKPIYDSIQGIDKDSGLYLVSSNNKQGIINQSGKIIVYQDYDQIGLSETYNDNNVVNRYLLFNNCIPVLLNKKWGFIDKNGNQITELEYDGIGCQNSASLSNSNGCVLIPAMKGIVVRKDNENTQGSTRKYGIINDKGELIINIAADSAYSTTIENKTNYYVTVENEQIDIVNFWNNQGVNNESQNNNSGVNNNTSTQNSSVQAQDEMENEEQIQTQQTTLTQE